jgi:ribosomal protein S18
MTILPTAEKSLVQNPALVGAAERSFVSEKKRPKGNWKQRLVSRRFSTNGNPTQLATKPLAARRIRKSLLYVIFVKTLLSKRCETINYSTLKLLQAFLTKSAKIKARRKTRISSKYQRQFSKSIRHARALGLLPFLAKVSAKRSSKRRRVPANKAASYK